MFIFKRKISLVVAFTTLMIMPSVSFSGIHFVELPDDITNEMMANQTPDI